MRLHGTPTHWSAEDRRAATIKNLKEHDMDGESCFRCDFVDDGKSPIPPCDYDPTPYCSAGHKSAATCDCGPIADNE